MTPRLSLFLFVLMAAVSPAQPPIWTTPTLIGPALIPGAKLGDLNQDGVPEIVAGFPLIAEIRSGLTGGLIATIPASGSGLAGFIATVTDGGDQDGDGTADVILLESGAARVVRVVSGANFSLLHETVLSASSGSSLFGGSTPVVGCGDLNGDNRDDFAIGDPSVGTTGVVEFRSGEDGSLLHTVAGIPGSWLGRTLLAVGDRTGDLIPDVLVGAQDGLYVVSGAGGPPVLLLPTANTAVDALDASRDVNGDGTNDVAVGCPGSSAGGVGSGEALIISGTTGQVLFGITGQAQQGLGVTVSLGDTNGDSIVDLAAGCLSLTGPSYVTVRSSDSGAEIFSTATLVSDSAGAVFLPDFEGDGSDELLVTGISGQFMGTMATVLRGGPALFGPGASGANPLISLLTVNGSTGGPVRRLDLPVGQPVMIHLDQSSSNPNPANHIVFAWPSVPLHNAGVVLPGVGPFLKAPPPIDPRNRSGFTLASSISGIPGLVVFNSFPGQYCLNLPTGIPPGDLTLQGVAETAPGSFESTNGVTLRVR